MLSLLNRFNSLRMLFNELQRTAKEEKVTREFEFVLFVSIKALGASSLLAF